MRTKANPNDLAVFVDQTHDPMTRASAMARLMADRRYEIETHVEQALNADFYYLRAEAILGLLGKWKRSKWLETACDFLMDESQPREVLTRASTAMVMYYRSQRKHGLQILSSLAQAVHLQNNPRTRQALYQDFLTVLGIHEPATVSQTGLDHQVDDKVLQKYLSGGA